MSDPASVPAAVAVPRRPSSTMIVGGLMLALIVVSGLLWAKWFPYASKIITLGASHEWSGSALFPRAASTPSLAGAWHFAVAYTAAVWRALAVSLLVAAAIDAFVSRRWLVRLPSRGGPWRQAGTGAEL